MQSRIMTRRVILEAILAVGLLWFWWRLPEPPDAAVSPRGHREVQHRGLLTGSDVLRVAARENVPPDGNRNSAPATTPLIGEVILHDYANPSNSPEHDLSQMSELMENFALIVKSAATRPLSANEDWARALRGFNPARERFLPDQHIALNSQGQLVDRWGSPLFFHAVGHGEFQIRSAGPDRKLWTADDLQRNADGSIVYGAKLQPPRPPETALHP
jgi:hypothetical protein